MYFNVVLGKHFVVSKHCCSPIGATRQEALDEIKKPFIQSATRTFRLPNYNLITTLITGRIYKDGEGIEGIKREEGIKRAENESFLWPGR